VFCITIFHTGIRPGELLKINLGIDLVADEFILQVPLLKWYSKVSSYNKLKLLCKYEVYRTTKYFYLFGSFKSQGKGKRKKRE
jgi:hypothetical protein